MRRLAWTTLTLTALLLAGCGDPGGGSGGPADDLAGAWELGEGTGPDGAIPLAEGHPITFTVEDDGEQVGGTAACNSYGATLARDGERLAVTGLFATEMGCSPAAVMDAEQAYLTALARVDAATTEGDTLTLTGDGVALTFARLPETVDEPLVGTSWVLDTLLDGETAATVPEAERPMTLELAEDGTYRADTGCNTLDGQFVDAGDRLDLRTVSVTDVACPAPFTDVQEHVVAVLDHEVAVDRAGERLTLTADDGLGLGYRAAAASGSAQG
ncbi:MAG: META domain-containing protein [Egibacteraceae bacterium]